MFRKGAYLKATDADFVKAKEQKARDESWVSSSMQGSANGVFVGRYECRRMTDSNIPFDFIHSRICSARSTAASRSSSLDDIPARRTRSQSTYSHRRRVTSLSLVVSVVYRSIRLPDLASRLASIAFRTKWTPCVVLSLVAVVLREGVDKLSAEVHQGRF